MLRCTVEISQAGQHYYTSVHQDYRSAYGQEMHTWTTEVTIELPYHKILACFEKSASEIDFQKKYVMSLDLNEITRKLKNIVQKKSTYKSRHKNQDKPRDKNLHNQKIVMTNKQITEWLAPNGTN